MDDIAIVRAIHVISVVIWIGGVAMVTTVVLPAVRRLVFVGELLVMRARKRSGVMSAPDVNAPQMQRLHWVLLVLSVITVMAVAGSHGMRLAP
jgi:uncharacterized membrane protein